MRILVCGGRDFTDRKYLFETLDYIHAAHSITCIIHGAARGADTLAGDWANCRDVATQVYPADWNRDGRSAGPIRNARMLTEGKPDEIVAFRGGNGTADMMAKATAAGLKVTKIQ